MSIDKSCELCGTNNEYCPECGTCHKCLREVNLSLQQLAAEAAKFGYAMVPVDDSDKMLSSIADISYRLFMADENSENKPLYKYAYQAMIEAGAVKVEE